jgi:Ca2+-binding RTX toxin-like protein
VSGTSDDLETEKTIAGLKANAITMLMVQYNYPYSMSEDCYKQLAGATGGAAVLGGGGASLADQVDALVERESRQINRVDLKVDSGCKLNVAFDPAPPYGPMNAPADIGFREKIGAGPSLPAGSHHCTVTAVADGADRATEAINAAVRPSNQCTINGTSGNDRIHGTPGDDVICAGSGDDVVYGGGGHDRVYAGSGNDVVYGGSGDDALYGGSGNDRLYGQGATTDSSASRARPPRRRPRQGPWRRRHGQRHGRRR